MQANVAYFALLTEAEKSRLRGDIQVFVAENYWEGCHGLELTDEMRVTVAAFACLLQLNLERREYYPNVQSILLYPTGYQARNRRRDGAGVVTEKMESRLGEAWENGPIVLAWEEV